MLFKLVCVAASVIIHVTQFSRYPDAAYLPALLELNVPHSSLTRAASLILLSEVSFSSPAFSDDQFICRLMSRCCACNYFIDQCSTLSTAQEIRFLSLVPSSQQILTRRKINSKRLRIHHVMFDVCSISNTFSMFEAKKMS